MRQYLTQVCRLSSSRGIRSRHVQRLDNENVEALQVIEGQLIDCVTQDRLLNEEDIAVGFLDLFDQLRIYWRPSLMTLSIWR